MPNAQFLMNYIVKQIQRIREEITARIEGDKTPIGPLVVPESSPIGQLAGLFDLTNFEIEILLLGAAMELDRNFAKLCAEEAGDPLQNYPTLALAFNLFADSSLSVLSPNSPLQEWQMLEFDPSFAMTRAPLRLDKRIFCYILGDREIDRRLTAYVRLLGAQTHALPPSQAAIAREIVATWSRARGELPILQLCGREYAPLPIIAEVCSYLDLSFCLMSASVLPAAPEQLHLLLRRWEREAILGDRALLLDCYSYSEANPAASLSLWIENLQSPLILCSRSRLSLGDRISQRQKVTFDIPPLSYEEQKTLWTAYMRAIHPPHAEELNGDIAKLSQQFQLEPAIVEAASLRIAFLKENSYQDSAESSAENNGEEVNPNEANPNEPNPNEPNPNEPNHNEAIAGMLWDFCRTQARPRLDDLAQRIETSATWEDLVLPDPQGQVLEEIAIQLQNQATVYRDWGFASKSSRGLGISALFHGASGTGKTMAAEVIARQLKLDLYRIDLSATVSKYIGETEKNLARIFDAAAAGGVILLFDEADALFGKRSEVKDSRDRNANIEVSYLLQRMEAYQGLAILTTNLKDALDAAFMRRIRFRVEFPFPEAKDRSEIWRRVFPSQTPTKGLDYKKLGKLQVVGGHIRNIAMNAAFHAAGAGEPVMMKHILLATQSEYKKMQKMLTKEEVSRWV